MHAHNYTTFKNKTANSSINYLCLIQLSLTDSWLLFFIQNLKDKSVKYTKLWKDNHISLDIPTVQLYSSGFLYMVNPVYKYNKKIKLCISLLQN